MVPATFANFFLATAGAGGALIGLLFVAVSIDPERTFGRQAHPLRQGVARGAFAALVNAFFVSTWALLPFSTVGDVALVVAVASLLDSGRFGVVLVRSPVNLVAHRRWLRVARVVGAVGPGLALYGYECFLAALLLLHPGEAGFVYVLGGILLGVYALGLVRAWELLGAPRGLILGLNPLDERWDTEENTDARAASQEASLRRVSNSAEHGDRA